MNTLKIELTLEEIALLLECLQKRLNVLKTLNTDEANNEFDAIYKLYRSIMKGYKV